MVAVVGTPVADFDDLDALRFQSGEELGSGQWCGHIYSFGFHSCFQPRWSRLQQPQTEQRQSYPATEPPDMRRAPAGRLGAVWAKWGQPMRV
ncbi:hypothetical protein GCM10017557_39780 [Streptomyces aurantiacus]|uniref:Uncharacterized protein n=1 Tax=Streptomyces aurantiacus TaxID=47760 RepID=A0A7G1P1M1_9ACTN|nr:hypothetical protein GCM10017557_39780 [Streptomyces aurantiacus]